jgi:cation:H+ antiporter
MILALYLAGGLIALYFGAEWLVRGAAALARRLGLSPLMVGLTVVGYGTSAPEFVVSVLAALQGQGALALGNAVGSNIFNVGVVLGLSALIVPLRVQYQLVKLDTPLMLGVAIAFLLMYLDGQITRGEAVLLLISMVAYTLMHVRLARKTSGAPDAPDFDGSVPQPEKSCALEAFLILAGLAALVGGSRLFVEGAVGLARWWGVSEAVIGLTIVAAGTSLPELAASLVAAGRGQADIAVGSIVGSNIYNLLAIVGAAGSLAGPLDGTGLGLIDVGIMVGISGILLPLAWTGYALKRWEGVVLLAVYGLYLWHVWPR